MRKKSHSSLERGQKLKQKIFVQDIFFQEEEAWNLSTITGRWPLVFWTKSLSTYLAASELHIKMFYSDNKGNNKNITNKEFDKLFPVSHLCLLFAYLGVEIFEFRGQKKRNNFHWPLSEFLEYSFITWMNESMPSIVNVKQIFSFSPVKFEKQSKSTALFGAL